MANRLPKFASGQAAPVQHWSEQEYTAPEDWNKKPEEERYEYVPPWERPVAEEGVYSYEPPYTPPESIPGWTPKVVDPYAPEVYTPEYPEMGLQPESVFEGEWGSGGVEDSFKKSLERYGPSLLENIVDVSDDEWNMVGQLGDYESRMKQVLSEGPLLTGHPSAGVTYPAAKKQAPAKKEDTKWADEIINWEGHPSAGVTYPKPIDSYSDPIQRIDTTDPRIKEKLAFEDFERAEVFPTIDMGKWYEPGIPEGDIRARMALEQGYAQPYPENINTTLSPSQLDAIQNPGLQAPSIFDDPLVDGRGTFAESNFVGPHDYAYGNIQDASSSLDPRVLAGLNNQAISHITDPSGIAGYVEGLPQPAQPPVYDDPVGTVAPRHMDAYKESMKNYAMFGAGREVNPFERQLMDMAPRGSNAETVYLGPQESGLVDTTVDQSRQRVPLSYDDRIQRVARAPRPQTERDTQMEMVKFYQSIGDNQRADDILRALDGGNSITPDQSVGLKATLDHIFSRK